MAPEGKTLLKKITNKLFETSKNATKQDLDTKVLLRDKILALNKRKNL